MIQVLRNLQSLIMSDKFEVPGVPAFNLTARDKEILALTDEQYHLQTWDDLKTIIGTSSSASPNQAAHRRAIT